MSMYESPSAVFTRPLSTDEEKLSSSPPALSAAISRRKAIPLLGLAALAVGSLSGCDLLDDPLKVDPEAEAEILRKLRAAAQTHRGGLQRFAVQHLREDVAVRVEGKSTKGNPDRLQVTVYERDPSTGGLVMQGGKPKVVEVHRNLTNATLSQIESDYVLFYYLYDN